MAVLLIKLKHIGDVLLSTAAVRHLKCHLKDEPVCMLVRGGTEVALSHNPDLADVHAFGSLGRNKPPFKQRLSDNLKLLRWLRRWRFRAVIDFSASDRGGICSLLTGARRRITYNNPDTGSAFSRRLYSECIPYGSLSENQVMKDVHLVEHFTGTQAPNPRLVYEPERASLEWAEHRWAMNHVPGSGKELRIACHPTSRWMFKCWDKVKMGRVLAEMHKRFSAKVIITHGSSPTEQKMARDIADASHPSRPELAGVTTFDQLAGLLKTANLFIGIDSAPMHLAAAVGTPVAALFGPSDPVRWRPWCERFEVVNHPCTCQLNLKMTCDKTQVMRCLQAVTEDQVITAACRLIPPV